MSDIKGIIPPMITVFNEDESIDERRTRDHVNFLIENGVHGIAPSGSTGEFIAMTLEEQKRVIEIVIDEARGRVPIYAGTAHFSTKLTIDLSQYAQRLGAAGVMVVLPYYMQPTQPQVMDHYRALAKSIDIPVILYNNPWFAGFELSPWDIAQLVEERAIASIKAAHGDPDRVHDLKYLCGDRLSVLYGHDYCALEGLVGGADGWLSGILNVFPRLCRDVYDAVQAKKIDMARELFWKMIPYCHFSIHQKEGRSPHWLSIVKASLNAMGRNVGLPRKPLAPLTGREQERLKTMLVKVGAL